MAIVFFLVALVIALIATAIVTFLSAAVFSGLFRLVTGGRRLAYWPLYGVLFLVSFLATIATAILTELGVIGSRPEGPFEVPDNLGTAVTYGVGAANPLEFAAILLASLALQAVAVSMLLSDRNGHPVGLPLSFGVSALHMIFGLAVLAGILALALSYLG